MESNNKKLQMRPPVVAIMGHIDHGKSTLLDYIRKTNIVDLEAGGITQKISAYEVEHPMGKQASHGASKDEVRKITFLDTPGHEAFSKMRERGAEIADIAILIVSAEDGVKPQTVEAWKTISESKVPVIVAINKIDKPSANVDKTKQELAEAGIYLEGYGGSVPFALISAKAGTGVDELLGLILVLAELEDFKGDPSIPAEGGVIEAHLDSKRGVAATLIVKNGTLKRGDTVVAGGAMCSTRIMENFKGGNVSEVSFSSPVLLTGFDQIPEGGSIFVSFRNKKEAQEYVQKEKQSRVAAKTKTDSQGENQKKIIPIVLKADVAGMLEALEKEIEKIKSDSAEFRIVHKGVGPISENDLKAVLGSPEAILIGFNVKADKGAAELALKRNIEIATFNIIYKMTEWLKDEMEKRRPKVESTETVGQAKILKTFSKTKERQVIGGKVLSGTITLGKTVKILRRDFEIGKGKIVGLQKNKEKATSVEEGSEFGMMLETKVEVAPGDTLEAFSVVQR